MDKPRPKREVAIDKCWPDQREIRFFASSDALNDFGDFGRITKAESTPNCWHLSVDARYDFEEVRAYIENYG